MSCVHFTGVQHDACKVGVRYENVRPLPCLGARAIATTAGITQAKCDFYREATTEERAAEDAEFEKLLEKLHGLAEIKVPPGGGLNLGDRLKTSPPPVSNNRTPQATSSTSNAPRTPAAARNTDGPGDASVGKTGLRRMLIALAQRNGLTRSQLGMRAQVSSKGGSFDTYVSKGRVNGWITGSNGRFEITAAGVEALGSFTPLPTGRALLEHYLRELGSSGAGRMLKALADVYPNTLTRDELGGAASVSPGGGSFDTYVSKLRVMELLQGERGAFQASAEFFEEA